MRLDQCAVAPPLQDQEARLHQHPRRAGVSELARGLGSGTGLSSIQVTACMSMCGVSWSVRSARQRDPIGPFICRNRPPASSRPIAIGSALSPQAKGSVSSGI